jgi:hypothetical protein
VAAGTLVLVVAVSIVAMVLVALGFGSGLLVATGAFVALGPGTELAGEVLVARDGLTKLLEEG